MSVRDKKISSLKKERSVLRTSFSKAIKNIDELLGSESEGKGAEQLYSQFELVKCKINKISEKDSEIYELLLEDEGVGESELLDEQEKTDHYQVTFFKYQRLLDKGISEGTIGHNELDNASVHSTHHKYKLPKLKLQEFDGQLKNWLPFWGQFEKIHMDPELGDVDKLSYLTMYMMKGTPARELVDSYPATGNMYNQVVEALKARFGREDLLTEVYIRELLKLVLANTASHDKLPIVILYDRLQSHLRNLESLGVSADRCAPILMPLVSSSLPQDLLQMWERCSVTQLHATQPSAGCKEYLDSLMNFLKAEVEGVQKLELAKSGFGVVSSANKVESNNRRKDKHVKSPEKVPTATGLVNSTPKGESCIFCSQGHYSGDCQKDMTLSQRQDIIRNKQVCYACLKFGHRVSRCRTKSRLKCEKCGSRHLTILCPRDSKSDIVTRTFVNTKSSNVLLQTLVVKIRGKDGKQDKLARLMIDTGSQQSYVLEQTMNSLSYTPITKQSMRHALFGGSITDAMDHNLFKIVISNLDNTFACDFDVFGQSKICSTIPSIPSGPWIDELKQHNIELTDLQHPSTTVDILVGADIAGKFYTGKRVELPSGLVAMETCMGWTLSGKMPTRYGSIDSSVATLVTSLLIKDANISDLWSLDVLGIQDPMDKSKADLAEAARKHFLDTVQVNSDNRFEVHLPWIEGHPPLASNLLLSQKRLEGTVKKLRRDQYYADYKRVLDTWEMDKIIERVPQEELDNPGYYMPHHHVVKPGSTTPVRPVFDASAKDNGVSLNDCLEKGPNLIETIPTSLAKFRINKIGISGDIAKAFLQISVSPQDRDCLRFLWQDENGRVITYRHCRVVFGVSSSPFLLESCLKLHLELTLTDCREGKSSWPIHLVELLKDSFYVDNCLVSTDSQAEAEQFIQVASSIMKEKGFDLRGWELTGDKDDKPTNVLGLLWDKSSDTLAINIDRLTSMHIEKITKKVMLSAAHRIFDPIGVICAFALIPKLLIQKTWETGLAWNDEVDENTKTKFVQWMAEVPDIAEIRVPRWISEPNVESRESWSLHVFSDASKLAYAAAVFLRVEHSKTKVSLHLLAARARVAPSSKSKSTLTIPRLELLAASIATRLCQTVVKDYKLQDVRTTFWTDATTVLAWIRRNEPWNVFVMNRITEIRNLSQEHEWRHVPGEMNPADLPSRGCTMKKLVQCRWWEGPEWLKGSPEQWPHHEEIEDEDEVCREKKKTVVSSVTLSQPMDVDWHKYFSKYNKLVRMVGWMKRFKTNCEFKKVHGHLPTPQDLTVEELCTAETQVLKWVQEESCKEEDPRFSSLVTFLDEDGLIRVKTKISNRQDLEDSCCPVVLPRHPVVLKLVMFHHLNNCHAGTQILMSILRQKYWILGGRRVIRSVLNSCITCKRYTARKLEVAATPLPGNRVRNAKIFEVTGIDFAGPLYVKSDHKTTKKVWICLFTCAVYRAVKLELVSSLSTDSFIQAFRRFCSRQGRPQVVYSDNGTNFVGFHSVSEKLDWDDIAKHASAKKIEWRFNPPSSPWWGGWWERLIGILKSLLRRVLGHLSVDYEEMSTLLCECESVINSRPLTYMSDNAEDLAVLTPAMFLHELQETGVPEYEMDASDLRAHYKLRRELKKQLRERFRSEYLGQLKLTAKKKREHIIKVGDVVLIGDDNVKRLDWPMGRVINLCPGADGHVRVVKLRTSSGVLTRPIQRIYPLEFHCSSDDMTPNLHEEKTKVSDLDTVPKSDLQEVEVHSPVESEDVVPPIVTPPVLPSVTPTPNVDQPSRRGRLIKKPVRLDL
jgi:Arginine methyltransferase-interacting protein, contains RING Zn-finger